MKYAWFWSPALKLMALGDGGPYAGAQDVVAHEFSHGVIVETADLVYRNQPGAVNEAFADIFGELVEAQWDGACALQTGPDWLVGAALGAAVRNLQTPGALTMGATGHLLLSALHAPDAVNAVSRILEIGEVAPGSAAAVSIDEVYTKLKNEVEAAQRLREKFG